MTRFASSLRTATGCGCGGRCGCGGACGGSCSCSGGSGGGRARDGAIQRPRFFAGQLLTQEDLALIVDYAVGKARLRNRLLFGEGVVCGLTVTCPPCGDGTVVVSPGYALDCCGNDIHVSCPEEVNVNRLVRNLRLRQLDGWDCGDPCETKRCGDHADGDDVRGNGKEASEKDARRKDAPTQHYCLYIRYSEEAAEPVVPYISEAECGQVACEATRIVETYTFELRCGGEKRAPADLFAAFAACLGDLRRAAEMAGRAEAGQKMAARLSSGTAMLRSGTAPGFAAEDADALEAAMLDVERLAQFAAAGAAPPSEAEFRRILASLEVAAAGIARLRALDDERRKAVVGELAGGLQAALRSTAKLMGNARRAVARLSGELLGDALSRETALGLAEVAERHASTPFAAAPQTDEFRMLAGGVPLSGQQLSRLRVDAGQLRRYLEERLSASTRLTSCDLLDRLHRVRLAEGEGATVGEAERVSGAVEELAAILLEHLRDCLCLALNPPCAPPCEDPGVLLACLEVRDCEVVEICNMSRRFVLSPAGMRYFLPPLGILGTLLERVCCELDFARRPPRETLPDRLGLVREESYFLRAMAPEVEAGGAMTRVAALAGIQPEAAASVLGMLGHLAVLAPRRLPDVADLARRFADVARPVRPDRALTAIEAERMLRGVREEMRTAIGEQAGTVREAAVQEAGRLFGADVRKAVDEAVGRVSAELAPDRLDARLRATPGLAELKELTERNARLEAELKRFAEGQEQIRTLAEQVAELRKQVARQGASPTTSNRPPRS